MRKSGYVNLLVGGVLLLLAVIAFLYGPGPGALDFESTFDTGLHNSLYYLDLAKGKWAAEKHKPELAVPSMEDLTPYLGDWRNRIERFGKLGIIYKITPISETEPQSDVATLTRDLRFWSGFSHFYPAGTSYCIHKGWAHSPSSVTSSLRACYFNNRYLFTVALCLLALGNLLVFVTKKYRNSKQARGHS